MRGKSKCLNIFVIDRLWGQRDLQGKTNLQLSCYYKEQSAMELVTTRFSSKVSCLLTLLLMVLSSNSLSATSVSHLERTTAHLCQHITTSVCIMFFHFFSPSAGTSESLNWPTRETTTQGGSGGYAGLSYTCACLWVAIWKCYIISSSTVA